MPRLIEIELARDVVRPLVARIRDDAQVLIDGRGNGTSDTEAADVQQLVDLFPGDFLHTSTLRIGSFEAPAVLRACAGLRLRLRHADLSGISDADLERSADAEAIEGERKTAWMCYLFLATIQQIVLEKLPPPPRPGPSLVSRLIRRLRRGETEVSLVEPVAGPGWQVVVLNDPVNLMRYVTYVFEGVFGMERDAADRHMREVHEHKSSIVWEGRRDIAEQHVRTLKSWHLAAELRERRVHQPDAPVSA